MDIKPLTWEENEALHDQVALLLAEARASGDRDSVAQLLVESRRTLNRRSRLRKVKRRGNSNMAIPRRYAWHPGMERCERCGQRLGINLDRDVACWCCGQVYPVDYVWREGQEFCCCGGRLVAQTPARGDLLRCVRCGVRWYAFKG